MENNRINKIRLRYQTDTPVISIERAKYYTEKWRELESSGLPLSLKIALSMKHVFEKMTHHVSCEDRLAGAWTEHFLGWPVDIERGLFNNVLKVELDKASLFAYRAKSIGKFGGYLIKKLGPAGLYRELKKASSLGPAPVNMDLKTLQDRKINPFAIDEKDKKILKKELLTYWEGKSMIDIVDRELKNAGLYCGEMAEFIKKVPNTPSKQVLVVSPGASIATYQGHLVLDNEKVLKKGLLGIKAEIDDKLNALREKDEKRDFYQAASIALSGLIIYAKRLADNIEEKYLAEKDPVQKNVYGQMLDVCRKVPLHPAENFREAVQSLWTHRVSVELSIPDNVHAPGRLDQLLFPYYEKDKAVGLISFEQARELMEEFLLKVMVHQLRPESNFLANFYLRYEGSTPITLGGLLPDGKDATNEMTYVLLEAADRSKSITSTVVRVHKDTPQKLYQKVAGILFGGTSSLSMMNDDVFIPALQRYGFLLEDARGYAITGCTDLIIPGKTGGISFMGLLLGHVLDLTLRNGDAQTLLGSVNGVGPKTGDPRTFTDFDQLLDAFFAQADFQVKLNVDASNLRDRLFAQHLPAPFLSPFIEGCLETGTDITAGGAVYNFSGINMINSVANVVDSLFAMKKLIFEQKRLSFDDFMQAVDANFEGHDEIYKAVMEIDEKWGNAKSEIDEFARNVTTRLFETIEKYRAFKGDGPVAPFINSMTSHTVDGRLSTATPDGRKAATPYASSCNPYNVERAGVTGVLKSVAAIDFSHILGCAVNVRLHPSAIGKTEKARDKWIALMKAYFQMGGAQIQPTVASADMLKAAQKDPESYRELIVKVGGYSTYFVDLGREIQDEIISRTEHCG